ncbi:MAG TPA: uracil-DNA glycosylase [Humisphaera sp.]|nr:uracil-DNA glycosylase [Humisphaera sp.]
MDRSLKSRLRLWLQSERAMGLPAVGPVRLAALQSSSASALTEDLPADIPDPAPRTVDLFGTAEPAKPLVPEFLSLPVEQGFQGPELSVEEKIARLAAMNQNEVSGCPKCRLCEQRTHTVFGEGDANARLFFIGEGPGETEDRTGRPFVGRAGELLDKMIGAMGLKREQVYIANIVKCRPPGNREPAPDEIATCTPYLERQLEIIRPKVIVTLGRPATQHMLQTKLPMGRMRGHWQSWRGVKLMPTFHPAYILRNDTRETKAMVWSDLKMVMAELGLASPKPRNQS